MWPSRDEHSGAASSPWHAAGLERPVFLDERGRRHRLLRPFALLVVLLTAGWLAGLVMGATGFAGLAPLRPPSAAAVHRVVRDSTPAILVDRS